MKETGIIMSGNHPKLIFDGIKTMTRRVIKPQPTFFNDDFGQWGWQGHIGQLENLKGYMLTHCPYGQVGDRLWLRETHYRYGKWRPNGFNKAGKQKWTFKALTTEVGYSDNPPDKVLPNNQRLTNGWFKRPSIFMPRWASRITPEITEIRVERLQEITYQDIWAEGCPTKNGTNVYLIDLWDSLNAKRGYGWETNPWVWVISFRRL